MSDLKNKIFQHVKCRMSAINNDEIFKDGELEVLLSLAIATFNGYPPFTNITLDDKHAEKMAPYIVKLMVVNALAAKALVEAGREYETISDNGITVRPPNISGVLNNQYLSECDNLYSILGSVKLELYTLIKNEENDR